MPPKKRTTPFKEEHVIAYGLKIYERDPTTKQVVLVSCRFCENFGREEKVGAKRKATTNIHYFRCPFRVDVYTKHMITQHPVNWERYSASSNREKATFFDESTPAVRRNKVQPRVGQARQPICHVEPIHYFVNKDIVDVFIGDILFDPDENDASKERALSIFEDVGTPEESEQDSAIASSSRIRSSFA
jgi:hypothetical protein